MDPRKPSQRADVIGPVGLEIVADDSCKPMQAKIEFQLEGPAARVAETLRALECDSMFLPILANDVPGSLVQRMINDRFASARPLCVARATRVSLNRGDGQSREGPAQTRSLDGKAVECVWGQLPAQPGHVFVGPMTDGDYAFVAQLLAKLPFSYLLLSPDQLLHTDRARNLMRCASITQLRAADLEKLAKMDDLVKAVQQMRQEMIGSVLVTCPSGLLGFVEGRWIWQPHFRVRRKRSREYAEDALAGVVLAAVSRGMSWEEALLLGAAGHALYVENGHLPRCGFAGLRRLAQRTPTRCFSPWKGRATSIHRLLLPALYATAGALLTASGLLLL